MPSIYRPEFRDSGECIHCGIKVSLKKSCDLQRHLERAHPKIFENLKNAKPSLHADQSTLNFQIIKQKKAMDDLVMLAGTTSFALHLTNDKYFKVCRSKL